MVIKMIGKPKYKENEEVKFKIFFQEETEPTELTGKIYIVDKYGTFFDDSDVSYDIYVKYCKQYPDGCLFKHIREDNVYK